MLDVFHSVADLLEERDRENLETTLARVALELTQARSLNVWRTYRSSEGVRLRRRVALPGAPDKADMTNEPLLASTSDGMRMAYDTRSPTRMHERLGGQVLTVLPILSVAEVVGLMEIETSREIDRECMAMLTGLLRIYRSHLAALDYGDIDALTRLANRRTFDDHFNRFVMAETRREAGQRAGDLRGPRAHLAVADIDFFKQINDRFGHPYGDEVLVMFADLLRKSFRDTDKLFRFGGEEFVIMLSNCGTEDALAAFERFRAAVAAYRFPQVEQVTVSLGVTALRPGDSGSGAFGRADQALYIAKKRGRNRVISSEALLDSTQLETARKSTSDIVLF